MLKKVFSMALAVAMALSCVCAVSAVQSEANETVFAVIGVEKESETNVVSPRIIETIRFSHSGDGEFEVLDEAELVKGQKVTVTGTWGPSYENMWVMLEYNGRAVSLLLTSGKSATMTIPVAGTYELSISADAAVAGTLQITW